MTIVTTVARKKTKMRMNRLAVMMTVMMLLSMMVTTMTMIMMTSG